MTGMAQNCVINRPKADAVQRNMDSCKAGALISKCSFVISDSIQRRRWLSIRVLAAATESRRSLGTEGNRWERRKRKMPQGSKVVLEFGYEMPKVL